MEYNDDKRWARVQEAISSKEFPMMDLGTNLNHMIQYDIKHVAFTLSRYKFASKLLMYRKNLSVCELGCSEAWGALLLRQNTDLKRYLGVDLDSAAIAYNRKNLPVDLEFMEANFFNLEIEELFDAVISLDVIEHIQPDMEDTYCNAITRHLQSNGTAIIGTPSAMLSPYANPINKVAHINLYDQERLYKLCSRHFENVFIFNMNDEIVNVSFAPMSCYIFAVCVGIKQGVKMI